MSLADAVPADASSTCTATAGCFPPNYLHESWMDYLYWDTELDP